MQLVNIEIYKKLESILGKGDVLVYPGIADVDSKFPYVVYRNDSYTADRSKDGIESYNLSYTIEIVSGKFNKVDELSDLIRVGLDGYRSGLITRCWNTGGSYQAGDDFHMQSLNFEIECDGSGADGR